jgi:NADH:ubiquinone reductase (H+-translocating)
MSKAPKIVILGAGYGGIIAAMRLQKTLNYNEADVTLVNKHDYHYITTHLHMPAAGTDDPNNARVNIAKLIDESKINFLKGSVTEIRKDEKKVILEEGELHYDYLVIGLGGETETFGIPGMLENALSIRSINSSHLIREHIEYQFARFKRDPEREDLLTFIVGGAGFTGIEFVAELADRVPSLCAKFDIPTDKVKIYSVEAAPSIMPGFDAELVEYAKKVLEDKGIIFKIGIAIKEVTPDQVVLGNDEVIPTATVVWTGGIRGCRIVEEAGFEAMRGRVKVDEFLRAPGHEDVYIIGDLSLFFNAEGRPYPPTAQIAMQQGTVCADNVLASIRNSELKTFVPSIKGVVASLGKGEAIGVVGKIKLTGKKAAYMKKIVDARWLFILGGLPLVLKKMKFLK